MRGFQAVATAWLAGWFFPAGPGVQLADVRRLPDLSTCILQRERCGVHAERLRIFMRISSWSPQGETDVRTVEMWERYWFLLGEARDDSNGEAYRLSMLRAIEQMIGRHAYRAAWSPPLLHDDIEPELTRP